MTVAVSKMPGQQWSAAFGRSLQDLARAGRPPVVLLDCLRWLAKFALAAPCPFTAVGDKRKLLALKQLYDSGKRPLRNKANNKDPVLVANLLLLWLGSLPEPLFPSEFVPELLGTQQSDCYMERVAAVRGFLKKTEPFILEALFPLFEFLHHHLINQADRDAALRDLGRLFAPFVFGTPQEYGLPLEEAGLLAETVELMIAEYRPLFTQPYGLNRYEQDAARAAAAAAAKAAGAGSPLGAAPALSPVATGGGAGLGGAEAQRELEHFWTPFSVFAHSPGGCGSPGSDSGDEGAALPLPGRGEDPAMEGVLLSLLESTVSSLFDDALAAAEAAVGVEAMELGSQPLPALAAPSPSKALPVAVPARPRGPAPASEDFPSVESYSSDDWGSFSPTAVILGEAVAAQGCKPAAVAAMGGGAPELSRLGPGGRVLA